MPGSCTVCNNFGPSNAAIPAAETNRALVEMLISRFHDLSLSFGD
jgi:hypothetical protein